MKKNNEIQEMLKKTACTDLIVGLILIAIVYAVNSNYTLVCLLGFLVAIVNFYINSFVTSCVMTNDNVNRNLLIILGFVFRIILAGVIGIILYVHNKINIIVYALGYSFRFFSLVLYGLLSEKF